MTGPVFESHPHFDMPSTPDQEPMAPKPPEGFASWLDVLLAQCHRTWPRDTGHARAELARLRQELAEAKAREALLKAVAELADQVNMCFACGGCLVPEPAHHCDPVCLDARRYLDAGDPPPELGEALEKAIEAARAGGALE